MANINQLLSVTSYSTHMKDLWEELNHFRSIYRLSSTYNLVHLNKELTNTI